MILTKTFWRAALIRAAHTAAQTALGIIGVSAVVQDVDWYRVLSATALAVIISLLKSVAVGLPEVDNER